MSNDLLVTTFYKYLYFPSSNNFDTFLKDGEHTLQYTNPANFNDPVDCMLHMHEEEWLASKAHEYMKEIMWPLLPMSGGRRARLRSLVRGASKVNKEFQWLVDDANKELKKIRKTIFVTCFSSRYDIMPMWAHYAGNHQGFCLGYRFDEYSPDSAHCPVVHNADRFSSGALHEVLYSNSIDLSPIADALFYEFIRRCVVSEGETDSGLKNQLGEYGKRVVHDLLMKIIFSSIKMKDNAWSYEHEWRAVIDDKESDNPKVYKTVPNYYVSEFFVGYSASSDLFDRLKMAFPTARGYKAIKGGGGVEFKAHYEPTVEYAKKLLRAPSQMNRGKNHHSCKS